MGPGPGRGEGEGMMRAEMGHFLTMVELIRQAIFTRLVD